MTLRKFLPCLCVFFCLTVLATSASAHAFPRRENPKVGAIVTTAPGMIKIWFDEALSLNGCTLTVKNAAGNIVSRGTATVTGRNHKLLEVGVNPLSPGTYHVYWHALSADGHHTQGDYQFAVGKAPRD